MLNIQEKHERVHHWLRVNHDPSVGNNNLIFMHRAIGYENLQVNAIRIIADTRNQEKSKSPRVDELPKSGSRKSGPKPSQSLWEQWEDSKFPEQACHVK